MATKAAWNERARSTVLVPALPDPVARFLETAEHLTRDDLTRLAAADAAKRPVIWTAWDLLRDRLDRAGLADVRIAAKRRAWIAVNRSLTTLGIADVPDDVYWRIVSYEGAGAARAARFAACALIAPELLDEDILIPLLEPWRTAFLEAESSEPQPAGPPQT
jgi:hypothetical protein